MMTRLAVAAIPLQIAFLAMHFIFLNLSPGNTFLRESLPLIYLGATYAQWLIVAAYLSYKYGKPVPLLMHLPHLFSFLPLLRHVMLAAERTPSDSQSLTLAWVHTTVTHMFSLIATWLWQLRDNKWELSKPEKARVVFYAAAVLTTILIYAGLDFAFAESINPFAVGFVQFLLAVSVTGVLLFQAPGAMAIGAALIFSIGNAALLFDNSRSSFSVELSLAATSLTQYFALYVFESMATLRGLTKSLH